MQVGDLVKLKDHKVWYQNGIGKMSRRKRKGAEGVITWIAHRDDDTLIEVRVLDGPYLVTPEDIEKKVYITVEQMDSDCEQVLAELLNDQAHAGE